MNGSLCQLVDARKRSKSVEIQQKRKERNSREMSEWETRFNVRENEAKRRAHEERLKKLSVSGGRDMTMCSDEWGVLISRV